MKELVELKQIIDLLEKLDEKNLEDSLDSLILAKKVNELIEKSPNKPNYELNVLDIVKIAEPLTSKIISLILNYKINNDNILCKYFILHFLTRSGFKPEWIKSPQITAETADRLDICVTESGKYAIIIENKLKGAPFQRNQLARYVQKMRNARLSDDRIFVILLPAYVDNLLFDNINKSVWCLPPDWEKPNQLRKCAYKDSNSCLCDFGLSCDSCNDCVKNLRVTFQNRTLILDVNFIDWLEKICIPLIPTGEIVLKSAVFQFADFLKGIFNKRLNDKMIMEIKEFLRQELLDPNTSKNDQLVLLEQKIKEIDTLRTGILKLQQSISGELIDEWYENLKEDWGKWLKREKHKSFGISIRGVWCGCWCNDEEVKPWWGFQCNNPEQGQRDMVKNIMNKVGIEGKSENIWMSWDYTSHGDEICRDFYHAALELGLLE